MANFMLLIRKGTANDSRPERTGLDCLCEKFADWNSNLNQNGFLVGSGTLREGEGQTVTLRSGIAVIKGPPGPTQLFSRFLLINASGYGEALRIAKHCPILSVGGTVEINLLENLEIGSIRPKQVI